MKSILLQSQICWIVTWLRFLMWKKSETADANRNSIPVFERNRRKTYESYAKKCINIFGGEISKKGDQLEDLGVDKKIILK